MTTSQRTARIIEEVNPERIPWEELFAHNEPVIMRGLVSSWPLVEAGQQSPEQAMEYMVANYSGKPVLVYIGEPDMAGRFAYNESRTGLNYRAEKMNLEDVFCSIREGFDRTEHPYYYINSLLYDVGFPGLQDENNLSFDHKVFESSSLTSKIWVGTESRASAHYDVPSNIACCVVGKRRFTLFPPEQVHNLYPGPLEPTPGGQVTTMVDLKNPDFKAYPRFRDALVASVVADLEPGDALYYPSMWWHEVEARDHFNVMVNYWWTTSPPYMGNPMDAVLHAMLAIRERPEREKQAWRELFDYYIFGSAETPRAHLPEACHGALGEMDEMRARQLRTLVQKKLNR